MELIARRTARRNLVKLITVARGEAGRGESVAADPTPAGTALPSPTGFGEEFSGRIGSALRSATISLA
jgi:hypothetical protein